MVCQRISKKLHSFLGMQASGNALITAIDLQVWAWVRDEGLQHVQAAGGFEREKQRENQCCS